ncbi:unnamed protein product [Auanema sp. JU1783]|nr:unnamed protein product [Auanema sp. JU1783]
MSDDEDFSHLHADRNRKYKKAGGWQALGLDHNVFKGVEKKGFKQPTPIQRKTIPCILDGKDVVAMSRTGSGKTAAFIIPMLQKLKGRDTTGIRALLISPTRELALQTFKVMKELGRFTGLHCAILVGGDALEDQFSSMHENPDILIATPGRLLHVVVEMELKLNHVQYVVFDEADRLFEMGFQDQLTDTLKRIPENRQTLLFSATLPRMLVDFAKAGLTDPVLIRLDVDEKISDKLSMVFITTRADDKLSTLVHLCRDLNAENKQTVVFCATMKHVEYVVAVLRRAGVEPSFIYSQLDATARKMNIARFQEKESNILVVTDVAARGVDIPYLDYAINFHFPGKAKLFVHRVGRVARAGRSGTAISLIAPDELPYLTDLFLFFGKPMNFAKDSDDYDESVTLIGRVPDEVVGLETEFLHSIHDNNTDLLDLRQKATNAMMKYTRTRPPPSAQSAKRVKEEIRIKSSECSTHPFIRLKGDQQQYDILNRLSKFKAHTTIFELNKGNKADGVKVMKEKRKQHQMFITEAAEKKQRELENALLAQENVQQEPKTVDECDESELEAVFKQVVKPTKFNPSDRAEQRRREKEQHYIPYQPSDHTSESHLALQTVDFAKQAEGAACDMIADDDKGMYKNSHAKKWDRKKKRFVGVSGNDPSQKKIRTEEGTWLPASYKSGRYEEWKKDQKIGFRKKKDDDDDDNSSRNKSLSGRNRWGKQKTANSTAKNELRNVSQIQKGRRKQAQLEDYMNHRKTQNMKKKASGLGVKGGKVGKGAKAGKGGKGGGKGGKGRR